jgi:SulP family sulfate permease
VICDLSSSPYVDLAGVSVLLTLHLELQKLGISLRVTEARSSVRDLLRAEGLDEKVGPIDRFASVADLVENFRSQTDLKQR